MERQDGAKSVEKKQNLAGGWKFASQFYLNKRSKKKKVVSLLLERLKFQK